MLHEKDVTIEMNGYEVNCLVTGLYYAALAGGNYWEPNIPATFELSSVKPYPTPDNAGMPKVDISLSLPSELIDEITEEVIAELE